MSEEHSQLAVDRPDPARTTHELVNVLAAVQIHVFMARRTYGQGTEPGDGARPLPDAEPAPPDPAELLSRLEGMVDRALELANELDEQLRSRGSR